MNSETEPPDNHMYSWISFNNDTLHFYLAGVEHYENLLKEDINAIEEDKDLAFLLSEKEKNRLEIYQELAQVLRVQKYLEEEIKKQGADAWDYEIRMSHRIVRFLKSVGLLYLQHLKNRRNILASKSTISRHALKTVDQRISYFEEKPEIGVFKTATPQQMLVDRLGLEKDESDSEVLDEFQNVGVSSPIRPRPQLIDSIEIFDPELRSRCLDLFHVFQEDGQNERMDTVVTEATRIFETKLRNIAGAPDDYGGVNLAKFAFGGDNPKLVVSEIASEQEAAYLLFRGVFGFIRNRVHHHLIETLLPERVLQIVGMIDYLIFIAQDSARAAIESEAGS